MFDHLDKSTFLDGRCKTRQLTPIISPSLMVADQTKLLEDSLYVLSSVGGGVEWLHVDVIDGHYAPNMSFCPETVAALRRHMPHVFLDCHLMVTDPSAWVDAFAKAGASGFSFHVEATRDGTAALCSRIRAAGMQVGVAIEPKTPVDSLFPLIDSGAIDMVLVMMVKPGFAGQKFMPAPVEKVRVLRRRYPHLNIQVDGSINLSTVDCVAEAGANIVVPGQAVFKAVDRRKNVDILRTTIQRHLPNGWKSSL